jgi:hypothetical protein
MGILRFFDDEVVVRRLKNVDSTRRSFQATATADCCIQDLSREARQQLNITSEKVWVAWFRIDAEIQEGDIAERTTDGKRYLVHEISIKDYGINQHKEVILLEYNE